MAEEKQETKAGKKSKGPEFGIQRIYVKDLSFEAPQTLSDLQRGESVAVDGACLTVAEYWSGVNIEVNENPEVMRHIPNELRLLEIENGY